MIKGKELITEQFNELQLFESKDNIIEEILANDLLTTVFQPIFSSKTGKVFGYEALTRLKHKENFDISKLFLLAIKTNCISKLELKSREIAIKTAVKMGLDFNKSYLFINLTPEILLDPSHSIGFTDKLLEEFNIPKDKIVFEITEESSINNYTLFNQVINYYKNRGYKIAIDDFGTGYCGLKMLSNIKPDFVKIDKYFISNIDSDLVKQNIVDSITIVSHRLGIRTIAEGIERENELKTILGYQIDCLQGFLLHKPDTLLNEKSDVNIFLFTKKTNNHIFDVTQIGSITQTIQPIYPLESIKNAYDRFLENPKLRSLPVVVEENIVGSVLRHFFLENIILGRHGYGIHLHSKKKIKDIMTEPSLVVEASASLEKVSQRIVHRKNEFLYDDVYVTKNGKYFGIVPVYALLDAITDRNIALAKNANPLTGLPGNESINIELSKKIKLKDIFDVCYIDINNFKPYNDHYGFDRGDYVIKCLADIITTTIEPYGDFCFVGHLGGDDFILITPPSLSEKICMDIVKDFEKLLLDFHNQKDFEQGFYISTNRKNEKEVFYLLSISITIVEVNNNITSIPELASRASELKKYAKAQSYKSGKSVVVKDRRK